MVFKLSFSSLRVRTDVEALYLKQGAGRPVRRKPGPADLSSTTVHSPRLCLPTPQPWVIATQMEILGSVVPKVPVAPRLSKTLIPYVHGPP